MTRIASKPWGILPFEVNVSRDGPNNGLGHINKFGHNPSINKVTVPEYVWSGGGLYTFTADGGAPYFISSSSASDTVIINLQILSEDADEDWSEEEFTITLQGQTKVAITTPSGDNPVRFFRGYNTNGTALVGDVYIYEDDTLTGGIPDTHTKIRGVINAGDDQTEMAIYTVPSGKDAYFLQGYTQLTNSKSTFANFKFAIRIHGSVFRTRGRASCSNAGQGSWSYKYSIPPKLPAKTDVILTCVEVGADGCAVAAGFDILLIDTE